MIRRWQIRRHANGGYHAVLSQGCRHHHRLAGHLPRLVAAGHLTRRRFSPGTAFRRRWTVKGPPRRLEAIRDRCVFIPITDWTGTPSLAPPEAEYPDHGDRIAGGRFGHLSDLADRESHLLSAHPCMAPRNAANVFNFGRSCRSSLTCWKTDAPDTSFFNFVDRDDFKNRLALAI